MSRDDEYRDMLHTADSRFAPSQSETVLLSNDASHWLGANLESVLLHQATSCTTQDKHNQSV